MLLIFGSAPQYQTVTTESLEKNTLHFRRAVNMSLYAQLRHPCLRWPETECILFKHPASRYQKVRINIKVMYKIHSVKIDNFWHRFNASGKYRIK
ncbi:MAG: hypothetical protein ACI9D5_002934 [Candidatus Endobugula sp.]|jgi:hypothetical protein